MYCVSEKQEEENRLAKWQDLVQTANRAENSPGKLSVDTPTTTSERGDPPSPTLSDYVFSTPTDSDQEDLESSFPTPPPPLESSFPTPPPPLEASPDPGVTVLQSDTQLIIGLTEQFEESAAEEESNAPFRDISDTNQSLSPTVLSEYSSDDPNQILFVPATLPRVSASASQRSIKLLEKSTVIQKLLSDSQVLFMI